MTNLQALYSSQQRYTEALPIAVEVLDIRRRVSGEDHPSTLICAHNLAVIYDGLGRFDKAEPLYLRNLEAAQRVLGERHPNTCYGRAALGSMYLKQGRYADAEPLLLAARDGCALAFGADAPYVVGKLVRLYEVWGKPDKAAEWRKKLPASK